MQLHSTADPPGAYIYNSKIKHFESCSNHVKVGFNSFWKSVQFIVTRIQIICRNYGLCFKIMICVFEIMTFALKSLLLLRNHDFCLTFASKSWLFASESWRIASESWLVASESWLLHPLLSLKVGHKNKKCNRIILIDNCCVKCILRWL